MTPAPKTCAACGRVIEWRAKWERNWDEIKFCGERCRRERPSAADRRLEEIILETLRARGRDKTMCPSEALDPTERTDRTKMETMRRAARRLVARGEIQITQGGRVVDPSNFRGPIRLRLPR